MDLREPKRKRVGAHIKHQQPFPILIESENETAFGNDIWPLFIGTYTGDSVVVSNPEEMESIYTMGFFGKGSFSRGYPAFRITKKGVPPIIKERQWKRRKSWMEKIEQSLSSKQTQDNSNKMDCEMEKDKSESCDQSEENKHTEGTKTISMDVDENNVECTESDPSVKKTDSNDPGFQENNVECTESGPSIKETDLNDPDLQKDGDQEAGVGQLKHFVSKSSETTEFDLNSKVLVLADSDDEDIEKVIRNPQPHLEDERIRTVIESLNLTLEEAFFLSYALGCLHVIDMSGNVMDLKHMWTTFCQVKPNFIQLYVAYHYFRAKGWVVKTGYKFGGDFLLYKQGPAFYHASYIVLVEKVNSQLEKTKNSLTWTKLHGLNRLAESSGKDIITCQVLFPDSLTPEDLTSPKTLPKYQVNELLTRRWISSQEREEKET